MGFDRVALLPACGLGWVDSIKDKRFVNEGSRSVDRHITRCACGKWEASEPFRRSATPSTPTNVSQRVPPPRLVVRDFLLLARWPSPSPPPQRRMHVMAASGWALATCAPLPQESWITLIWRPVGSGLWGVLVVGLLLLVDDADDCWRTEAVGRLLGVQKCASGHPLWCTRLAVLGLWDGDLCCRVCRGPHFPARRSSSTRARRASIDALAGPLRPCLAGPSSATQTGVGLRAWSGQAAAAAASCLRRTPRASWFLSRNGRPVRLAVAHAD